VGNSIVEAKPDSVNLISKTHMVKRKKKKKKSPCRYTVYMKPVTEFRSKTVVPATDDEMSSPDET
jgi:hypothetical protein